jgi:hypothetical protein
MAKSELNTSKKEAINKAHSGFSIIVLIIISLLAATLGQLFGSCSTSPIFAGTLFGVNETDPDFFIYVGLAMNQGKLPYIDVYDQKGLYMFAFEGLGYAMGGRTGIFILLCIAAFITIFCILMAVRSFSGSKFAESFIAILYTLLIVCFKYGNHTGDMIMPWVSLGLLFYCLGLNKKKKVYFFLGSFFAGVEAGFGLNSRPTEAIWGLALVTFYFIYWLKNERNWNLLWNALLAIGGLAIPLGGFVIAAYSGGYLSLMWDAVFTQGFAYVGNHNDFSRLMDMGCTIVFTLIMLGMSFITRKKWNNDVFIFFFVVTLLTGIMNSLIARFPHYWLSSLPLVLLLIYVTVLPKEEVHFLSSSHKILQSLCSFLASASLAIMLIWPACYYGFDKPIGIAQGGELSDSYSLNKQMEADFDKTIKASPTYESDTVFCVDCKGAVYVYLDKVSPFEYCCYNSWHGQDRPDVIDKTVTFINTGKPNWIVCSTEGFDVRNKDISKAINDNYTVVLSNYYFIIYSLN